MSAREERTTTRALLEEYLAGDRESERRLFAAHRADLVARAASSRWMSGLAAHVAPEDLVDEVFLRVLSSDFLRRFEDRGSGSLGKALAAILDDVAVDAYRRHGAAKRSAGAVRSYDQAVEAEETAAATQSFPSQEATPTSAARANELVELCRKRLEPREWEVWRLFELEGLDSPAVAARLGTTDAAVRGLFRRARLRILRALAEEQDPESG